MNDDRKTDKLIENLGDGGGQLMFRPYKEGYILKQYHGIGVPLFLEHLHRHEANIELGFRSQDSDQLGDTEEVIFFIFELMPPQYSKRQLSQCPLKATISCHHGELCEGEVPSCDFCM